MVSFEAMELPIMTEEQMMQWSLISLNSIGLKGSPPRHPEM